MKILHSVQSWLPQTQTWMYNQIRALNKTSENHIGCERTELLEQFQLPNIHCLSREYPVRYITDKIRQKLGLQKHLSSLERLAQKTHAQILHTHFANFGYLNIKVAQKNNLKHVVTFYGFDVNMLPNQFPVWKKRYQELFKTADLFLCEGPFMANAVVQLGCSKEKVKVHHIGVSLNDIPFDPRTWTPGEPLGVLIAASFQEKKGIPYAIEALYKVSKKIPLSITVIGDSNSEPASQLEKTRILELANKLKMTSRINFLGYQPYKRLLEEAYKHHIYLCPSVIAKNGDTEGGAPVTLLEMMASGMPIIGTNHCDIPNIIKHAENGRLAQEREVNDLASQILWFVENSRADDWNTITKAARLTVEESFSIDTQANKLLDIYQQLLT